MHPTRQHIECLALLPLRYILNWQEISNRNKITTIRFQIIEY